MNETQDPDQILPRLAREDATKDIAQETPIGQRRELYPHALESLGKLDKRIRRAEKETAKQIKKERKIGGTKLG